MDTGIGIYNGLFHSTAITHSFDLFIYIIGAIILLLTAFYPRRIEESLSNKTINNTPHEDLEIEDKSSSTLIACNLNLKKDSVKAYKNLIVGIDAPQFSILEYPLIISFILLGAIFLMSSSDIVTMFLAIELQSYGLYILATLNRDSE
ncbi:MAG: hypothetical protein O7C56_02255 [Rickettsia endosymbiont of Ixodes persulcatus]|nr:hypothetical protein [Rickettsia endosymbiont of Ixodes persulcatus]